MRQDERERLDRYDRWFDGWTYVIFGLGLMLGVAIGANYG